MIRSASLIYAVIISLILAILSSAIVFSQYYQAIESDDDLIQTKLRLNATSAINYFLVSDIYNSPSTTQLSLYDGIQDSVTVTIEKWGLLDIIHAQSSIGNKNYHKLAFIGDYLDKINTPTLYLADNNSPLSLCGKTVIKGNCYLPKSGVKRAYIEGQNFIGSQLINGKISISNSSLPAIDKKTLNEIRNILDIKNDSQDTTITEIDQTKISNTFNKKPRLIFSEAAISLDSKSYGGKIIILSKKEIKVSSQTSLTDVILFAPKITIADNFIGTCQLFASDSILIGKNVHLKYPSVVSTITNGDENKSPKIVIEEEVNIGGLILMDAGYDPVNKRPNLIIGKKSLITGTVYCNGIVSIGGDIIGSLYCMNILLKTPTAVYNNHLLNTIIDISPIPDNFATKNFLSSKSRKKIIKWL